MYYKGTVVGVRAAAPSLVVPPIAGAQQHQPLPAEHDPWESVRVEWDITARAILSDALIVCDQHLLKGPCTRPPRAGDPTVAADPIPCARSR